MDSMASTLASGRTRGISQRRRKPSGVMGGMTSHSLRPKRMACWLAACMARTALGSSDHCQCTPGNISMPRPLSGLVARKETCTMSAWQPVEGSYRTLP